MVVFGLLALVIGLAGVSGVVSAVVALQILEFGVRLALGASGAQVVGLVVTRTGVAVIIGAAMGLPVAALLARTSEAVLFNTDPLDPGIHALVLAFLAITSVLASLLPARRAARAPHIARLLSERCCRIEPEDPPRGKHTGD